MMPRWSFAADLLAPRFAAAAVGLDGLAAFAVPAFPAVATPLPASACVLEPINNASCCTGPKRGHNTGPNTRGNSEFC